MSVLLDITEPRGASQYAIAVCKQAFELQGHELVEVEAAPLRARRPGEPVVPGDETTAFKPATDVIVHGSAFAKNGLPVAAMEVRFELAAIQRRFLVLGDRRIVWRDGRARIETPDSFIEVPLTHANAYGGVDRRVRPKGEVTLAQFALAALGADHPGLYPRNPIGKGYLVNPEPLDRAMAPNVEDVLDLLTEDRLVVGDAHRWYFQPLPACMEWQPLAWFPRMLAAGVDAWFTAPPEAELPERRRGWLPPDFRDRPANTLQEASPGMTLADVRGGEPLRISGMHPDEPTLSTRLPPAMEPFRFRVDGSAIAAPARAQTIEVWPAEKRLTIVWAASCELPRVFLPGVHKRVPISVAIRGSERVYEPPPTIHDRLVACGFRAPGGVQ